MPEIPDIVLYVNSLDRLLRSQTIESLIVRSPFVVRTVDPPIDAITGQRIESFSRIGKRVCWHLNDDHYCPGCQTEGRILADRSLSRLLKDDWPKTLDDLEEMRDAKK